MKLTTKNRW